MGLGLMKACWLEQEGNTSSAETCTWIDTVVMEHHTILHRVVATSTILDLDGKVRRGSFSEIVAAMPMRQCNCAVPCCVGEMKPKRHRLRTLQQLIGLQVREHTFSEGSNISQQSPARQEVNQFADGKKEITTTSMGGCSNGIYNQYPYAVREEGKEWVRYGAGKVI